MKGWPDRSLVLVEERFAARVHERSRHGPAVHIGIEIAKRRVVTQFQMGADQHAHLLTVVECQRPPPGLQLESADLPDIQLGVGKCLVRVDDHLG